MTARRDLLRFAVAGAIGFGVDATVLYAALSAGLGYYAARAVSFGAAVVATWLINRHWAFAGRRRGPLLAEFARYLAGMMGGGAVNYGAYAVVVAWGPPGFWLPLAGTAVGSLAGLVVNFALARHWVFRAAGTARVRR